MYLKIVAKLHKFALQGTKNLVAQGVLVTLNLKIPNQLIKLLLNLGPPLLDVRFVWTTVNRSMMVKLRPANLPQNEAVADADADAGVVVDADVEAAVVEAMVVVVVALGVVMIETMMEDMEVEVEVVIDGIVIANIR